jgi:F0F1-type ATP synthase beta subunit
VIEIFFPANPPRVYDAVKVKNTSNNSEVIIEVLQQLEDGVVR